MNGNTKYTPENGEDLQKLKSQVSFLRFVTSALTVCCIFLLIRVLSISETIRYLAEFVRTLSDGQQAIIEIDSVLFEIIQKIVCG